MGMATISAADSFPPNPPPMRFTRDTILLQGMPSASDTCFWTSLTDCVLDTTYMYILIVTLNDSPNTPNLSALKKSLIAKP